MDLFKSIHNGFSHPILFYHLKKLLYQLYYTILQYSQHPFYFLIQYIKIIYLYNKISLSLSLSITTVKTQNPNTVYQKKKKNPTQKLIPNPKQTHSHADLTTTTTIRQPLTQSSSRRCRHYCHPLLLPSPSLFIPNPSVLTNSSSSSYSSKPNTKQT